MKEVVLKFDRYDDKARQKAMKSLSGFTGVISIANDMTNKKLTVTGDIDPVTIVLKLRKKICHTKIVTVGPAKEPEKKKEEPKKDDKKKDEVVLKLDLYDGAPICTLRSVFGPILTFDKAKQMAMKKVSGLTGVDSMEDMDMKDKQLTVTGDIDPVTLVSKLRKICHTEIVTVGPAKEPEKKKEEPKKKEPKKDDKKKEEPKKEEAKKDDKKKHEPKKDEAKKDDKKKEEPKKDEAKKDDKNKKRR